MEPLSPTKADSSSSLSAFVVLCESSRLSGPSPAPKSNSDAAELAFGSNRSASFGVGPQRAPAPPLKPPPRLQYVANIRKSLRVRRRLQAWAVAGRRRKKDDDDPFVVAVEKVTREDAPWCQLPRGRRPEVRGTDDDDEAVKVKRRGIVAWLTSKSGSSKDAGHGELVGLPRCTAVSSYRNNTHYGSSLLACFGLK